MVPAQATHLFTDSRPLQQLQRLCICRCYYISCAFSCWCNSSTAMLYCCSCCDMCYVIDCGYSCCCCMACHRACSLLQHSCCNMVLLPYGLSEARRDQLAGQTACLRYCCRSGAVFVLTAAVHGGRLIVSAPHSQWRAVAPPSPQSRCRALFQGTLELHIFINQGLRCKMNETIDTRNARSHDGLDWSDRNRLLLPKH